MRALVLIAPGQLQLQDHQLSTLRDGYARIRIITAAINMRDEWILQGKYARIRYPVVIGSDCCGIVEQINAQDQSLLGRRIIVNPNQNWGTDLRAQGKDYTILGMPSDGTFAQWVDVPIDRLFPAPPHLSDVEAAALPLAGLTAYRAVIVQGTLAPTETLLITGIGGGVASFCLQFAVATGAQSIFVTTGRREKLERAQSLGARGGVLYTDPEWDVLLRSYCNGFDLCIDSAGGEPFNRLVALAKPAGRIVVYGATLGGVPTLDLHRIFWKQLRIQGTTMGSDDDFIRMVHFVEQKKIHPIVDSVFPLEEYQRAFERIRKRDQFGKVVLRIAKP